MRNGVDIILKAGLKDKEVGLSEEEIKTFWDYLDETVREYSTDQRVFKGGDLNGHIGAAVEGYSGVHGGFGYGVRNEEGRSILDFATAHDLVVVNSFFKKRDHHLITFYSESHCIQIDYLLVRRGVRRACRDCTVFRREACSSQHRLLALDTFLKKYIALDAAKETLGVTIRSLKTHTSRRKSLWLSEKVQSKVVTKQARFRELLSCQVGNQEDLIGAHERYKEAKRQTYGKMMPDMIPNEVYRVKFEVKTIINKIREGRLRWYGHVRMRPQSLPVRRVKALVVDGSRRRGRPKLRWEDRLKIDMNELLLFEDMTLYTNDWRDRIRLGARM
nr:craniofacial development protein 2-like [Tanacetum cinerariifolium]